MNWKRIISSVLAAGMLLATPVQLLASAESAEDAESTNAWESLLTADDIDEENTFYYNKNGYTFEKLSHPEKDVKVADGIVDYLGDGAVDVVTDPEAEGYNAATGARTTPGPLWVTAIGSMWAPATQPSATPSL